MQLFIFLICVCAGIASGIIYDFLYIIRCIVCGVNKSFYSKKDKILTAVLDFFYFICFAAIFVFVSVIFEFYKIRLYMLIACALGAILYYKSFHFFIAFLINMVYNSIIQKKEK